MAQATAFINALKQSLKSHGLTYADVAVGLGMSEASIKRMLAQKRLSLDRLDAICELMGMDITDLAKQVDAQGRYLRELTADQEQEMVADIKLLLVATLVLNGVSFEEMVSYYQLSETALVRCLAKLDRLHLIQLLPKNRVKLLVTPGFAWRSNGPIQCFFRDHLQADFLQHSFRDDMASFAFVSSFLSNASLAALNKKLEQLRKDFHQFAIQDREHPITQRRNCSMMIAIRPWRPKIFEALRR